MCCLRTEDMMIRLFVVMMIPALCLGSCCVDLMGAPPQFMLSAPPRPPGVVIDLPCPGKDTCINCCRVLASHLLPVL